NRGGNRRPGSTSDSGSGTAQGESATPGTAMPLPEISGPGAATPGIAIPGVSGEGTLVPGEIVPPAPGSGEASPIPGVTPGVGPVIPAQPIPAPAPGILPPPGPVPPPPPPPGPRPGPGYLPPPPPPRPYIQPQIVFDVRLRYPGFGVYWTPDWYHRHNHYWRPPVYASSPVFWYRTPTWGVTWGWFDGYAPYYRTRPCYGRYDVPTPVYYNYGDNVVYKGDMVYVNGVPYVSAEKYYDQSLELARRGEKTTVIQIEQPITIINKDGSVQTIDAGNSDATSTSAPVGANEMAADSAEASDDPSDQWMPLGTYAIISDEKTGASEQVLQLAVNRGGIVRGNLYNEKTDKLEPIEGAVDQETQRVAFRVQGDNEENNQVYECGLWNLTQESLPILLHEGTGKTETLQVVRLEEPKDEEKNK
ncbi:MAG: hypothetical protein ACRC2T_06225, partial [Thermoguttaceae bacterium]